jgi:hypothetical protein
MVQSLTKIPKRKIPTKNIFGQLNLFTKLSYLVLALDDFFAVTLDFFVSHHEKVNQRQHTQAVDQKQKDKPPFLSFLSASPESDTSQNNLQNRKY